VTQAEAVVGYNLGMPTTVLLTEDDEKFRHAFSRAIEATEDLRLVGAAANGQQGLDLLRTLKPDVLLVDLDLPDFSGVELIRYAAKNLPECEIMVVTVFGDEKHVLASIEAGASGYLLKDSMPSDFVEQIRSLRAGGSPISPSIARQLLHRFQSAPVAEPKAEDIKLSERESSVLQLVSKGYTHAEIAELLNVSPHTVLTYVKRIYQKLQVTSKAEALHEARVRGLVQN
jgi:DNA-binding NarL/FixJ family response regulator